MVITLFSLSLSLTSFFSFPALSSSLQPQLYQPPPQTPPADSAETKGSGRQSPLACASDQATSLTATPSATTTATDSEGRQPSSTALLAAGASADSSHDSLHADSLSSAKTAQPAATRAKGKVLSLPSRSVRQAAPSLSVDDDGELAAAPDAALDTSSRRAAERESSPNDGFPPAAAISQGLARPRSADRQQFHSAGHHHRPAAESSRPSFAAYSVPPDTPPSPLSAFSEDTTAPAPLPSSHSTPPEQHQLLLLSTSSAFDMPLATSAPFSLAETSGSPQTGGSDLLNQSLQARRAALHPTLSTIKSPSAIKNDQQQIFAFPDAGADSNNVENQRYMKSLSHSNMDLVGRTSPGAAAAHSTSIHHFCMREAIEASPASPRGPLFSPQPLPLPLAQSVSEALTGSRANNCYGFGGSHNSHRLRFAVTLPQASIGPTLALGDKDTVRTANHDLPATSLVLADRTLAPKDMYAPGDVANLLATNYGNTRPPLSVNAADYHASLTRSVTVQQQPPRAAGITQGDVLSAAIAAAGQSGAANVPPTPAAPTSIHGHRGRHGVAHSTAMVLQPHSVLLPLDPSQGRRRVAPAPWITGEDAIDENTTDVLANIRRLLAAVQRQQLESQARAAAGGIFGSSEPSESSFQLSGGAFDDMRPESRQSSYQRPASADSTHLYDLDLDNNQPSAASPSSPMLSPLPSPTSPRRSTLPPSSPTTTDHRSEALGERRPNSSSLAKSSGTQGPGPKAGAAAESDGGGEHGAADNSSHQQEKRSSILSNGGGDLAAGGQAVAKNKVPATSSALALNEAEHQRLTAALAKLEDFERAMAGLEVRKRLWHDRNGPPLPLPTLAALVCEAEAKEEAANRARLQNLPGMASFLQADLGAAATAANPPSGGVSATSGNNNNNNSDQIKQLANNTVPAQTPDRNKNSLADGTASHSAPSGSETATVSSSKRPVAEAISPRVAGHGSLAAAAAVAAVASTNSSRAAAGSKQVLPPISIKSTHELRGRERDALAQLQSSLNIDTEVEFQLMLVTLKELLVMVRAEFDADRMVLHSARAKLAQAYYVLGHMSEALIHCEEAAILHTRDYESRWIKHLVLRAMGREQDAITTLEDLTAANSEYRSHRALGDLFYQRQAWASAAQAYAQALLYNSRDVQAVYHKALAEDADGQAQAAMQGFLLVLELDPLHKAARRKHADLSLARGSARPAIRSYTSLLLEAPADHNLYYARAQAHLQNRDVAAAINDLTQCIHLAPTFASAFYLRGSLLARSRPQRALRDFSVVLLLLADDDGKTSLLSQVHLQRGIVYSSLSHHAQALHDFAACLRLEHQRMDKSRKEVSVVGCIDGEAMLLLRSC